MSSSRNKELDEKILDMLAEKHGVTVREIVEATDCSSQKISGRMQYLRGRGDIKVVGKALKGRSTIRLWGLK